MNVKVLLKNMTGEEDVVAYTERKMARLSRYMNQITKVEVELSKEKTRSRQQLYTAQATLNIKGFIIRGEHKSDSLKAVVDSVSDIMERRIAKYKKKYEITKIKASSSIRKAAGSAVSTQAESETVPHLVKTKRFIVKPMTVEQAIDQMEYLGHDFFLFLNAGDDAVNMLYRRKDGKYGLIIPEYA